MGPHPYQRFVADVARLSREGKRLPLGGLAPAPRPTLAPNAPRVLIFAPHPDDECIIGGLPLRLLRESKMRVVNVALTQGSNKERQAGRLVELEGACAFLGFDLATTRPGGLERVNPKTRAQDPAHWKTCVDVIARIIATHLPRVVFVPHDADHNSTHIGAHHLVMDALAAQPVGFSCHVVETEFWGALGRPNLMVELSEADVGDLVAATSFHVEEVERNPYHLLLPAWMQDNVRRGSELVGDQGGAAPDFAFSTLYRARRYGGGKIEDAWTGGRQLGRNDDPAGLFT